MKASVNWMQYYAGGTKIMPDGVNKLVEKIGAQLGAVEEVIDLGKRYQGIVIAKVISCEDHPNADKLHICKIDDGGKVKGVKRDDKGYIQVVCGAPNVREGLLVAWLSPGTTVPATVDKDPLVLEAREIRGEVSNGMLASSSELAISDDHSGILEIDEHVKPGDDFAKTYKLDDYIIDIENKMFTHRPDLFGQLGVAREIAGITHQQFTSPDWYKEPHKLQGRNELKLTIKNEIPKLVPRFMAVALSNVTVKPSPIWLQTYLTRVGIRPINNIVDLTNYFMMLTAQPLHAYDYDKVKTLSSSEATIVIRQPKAGEKITLLSGREIKPRSETIMIATDIKLIGMGGVMGGADTEVDENTKNIILEAASFDMYSIRRTAMEHGLFTDAVTRFNKGQSPLQTEVVLAHAATDVIRLTGAKVASQVFDVQGKIQKPIAVHARVDFINARLGLKLVAKEMAQLLMNVEFDVRINGPTLAVTPPFWRTDIEIPEDLVEEVGRLYGYDHLPLDLPTRSINPAKKDELIELKSRVRDVLSRAGVNEVLTYSFVHGDLLDKVGQDPKQAFQLSNALSPDLQYYRLSITPSLLDKVHANIKTGYDEFAIFEIGKGHNKSQKDKEGLPKEFEMLALVHAATTTEPGAAFYYQARRHLDYLADELGLAFEYRPIEKEEPYQIAKPYDHTRSASVWSDGQPLGMVGEFRPAVARNLKLPRYSAGFEIGLEQLMSQVKAGRPYNPLSRFPKVEQDISLKVPNDLSYAKLYEFVKKELYKSQPQNCLSNLESLDIYQRKGDAAHKQITFRLTIASYERTLIAEEVNKLLNKIAAKAKQVLGAERL